MLHNKTSTTKFSWTVLGVIRESEKTDGQEVKAMMREYDLDTGRGYPVQACAMDLFKESRRQNLDQYKQLILSDKKGQQGQKVKQGSAIVEEAKRTVTKLLDEVSGLGCDLTGVLEIFC